MSRLNLHFSANCYKTKPYIACGDAYKSHIFILRCGREGKENLF